MKYLIQVSTGNALWVDGAVRNSFNEAKQVAVGALDDDTCYATARGYIMARITDSENNIVFFEWRRNE